ncbi:hypothetical protein [Streptomyces sp. NPDC057676]|uniref:hypothetical protein n=1 Tax=Streptomyces sp. NPDC057676 TaxID=3346205 RepID=UPI0036926A5F
MFSVGWMVTGNVRRTPLADILGGAAMAEATAAIRGSGRGEHCDPDRCDPGCEPNEECTPGYPGTECDPRN